MTLSSSRTKSAVLPLLPLKDMVIFPRMVVPLLVGRSASLAAVDECLATDQPLFLCAQRDPAVEEPAESDLYTVGVTARIHHTLRMPDGTMKVVVEGIIRCDILSMGMNNDLVMLEVAPIPMKYSTTKKMEALMRTVVSQFEEYARLSQRIAPEIVMSLKNIVEADALADLLCAHLSVRLVERQELLEHRTVRDQLEAISALLMRETDLFEMEQQVRDRVRDQMERNQREYYLQEQLRYIHQELGNREDGLDEVGELRKLIKKAKMPKAVRERAEKEADRYERMSSMSPEAAITRTYLEWLTELPWSKRTRDIIDLDKAREVLDEDHYGLKKIKERILEFLAVRKLSKSTKGPVLCLVGPPGVGKTSLGRSIARAMGRTFVRVSLGGMRDEAEIRGHRRTYIGSLPGRIIQSMKKAGVKNPLFMLDEIDKMNADFRGDPSSALLEVLDPEQNQAFSDHYLEVDYDLHEVFFITTANSEYDIPDALLDRMEVLRLSGYTPNEKESIAALFLVPKQMAEAGLTDKHIAFKKEGLATIIDQYTREAGVRELERQIANVCRKVAKKVVEHKGKIEKKGVTVDAAMVRALLGAAEYSEMKADKEARVGVAVGLAWTMAGGDILTIEAMLMRGKGELILTGQLGEVMQESAQAAYTYLRSNATDLGIAREFWKNKDVHIHVPEGAIPKDGPSAGTCLAVAMLSAMRGHKPRKDLAMTGEITLRGRILPVGGVKEKLLAAHRAGIKTVLLPRENEKDLEEIPQEIKESLTLKFVREFDEVVEASFEKHKARTKKRS